VADIASPYQDSAWSRAVKERDGYTCRWCGKPGDQPHHIVKRRFQETRLDVDNGVTLCFACHEDFERHPIQAKDRLRRMLKGKVPDEKIRELLEA
jgi:5-methylcytosine-specific restriction endonuclease McrA